MKNKVSDMIDNIINSTEFKKIIEHDTLLDWKSMSSRIVDIHRVKITNAGLLKAGKSSFFNALLDCSDGERFPTGAARKTIATDEEKLEGQLFLVDTPGIDARDEDDEKTFEAILESDIIVFIHNIKTGEYKRAEIEFINRICDEMDRREDIKDRLVFVASWIDEREENNDLNEVISIMQGQLVDACGYKPEIETISSKRYLKGLSENKENLKNKSNVLPVRAKIVKMADIILNMKKEMLGRHLDKLKKATIPLFTNKVTELKNKIERIEIEHRQRGNEISREWRELRKTINEKLLVLREFETQF